MKKLYMFELFLLALVENPEGISLANPAINTTAGMFYSHCLNSYVADAGSRGITVYRKHNEIMGAHRKYTLYWLPNKAEAHCVCALINTYRKKRNAVLLSLSDIELITSRFPVKQA